MALGSSLKQILTMGSSLKQILTMLIVSEQDTPASSAVQISVFNSIVNSANTLLSVWAATSQLPAEGITKSPWVLAAAGLYLVGISTEFVSELQRTAFKRDPANKEKPYAGGLFSLARHINYGGYTIWRAEYASASGGWLSGLLVGAFFLHDFVTRGVPVLDQYLSKRVSLRAPAIPVVASLLSPCSTGISGKRSRLESPTACFLASIKERGGKGLVSGLEALA
ncbi:DUF1295 domain-containing protein [Candidatus Bathyarchaeota archaeon]|nr:DUF1295 domain-containing protein [Candidatus Bathyarchaeota archaeon]